MSHATLNKIPSASVSPQAIALINSLGGPALSTNHTVDSLGVTLENHAAAQTPAWLLGIVNQSLRQQGIILPTTRAPEAKPFANRKDNRYMSF